MFVTLIYFLMFFWVYEYISGIWKFKFLFAYYEILQQFLEKECDIIEISCILYFMSHTCSFNNPFVPMPALTGAQLMEVDLDRNGRERRWIYDLLDLLFEFILSLQGIHRYSALLLILYLPYSRLNLDYYQGKAIFFVFSR